MKKIMWQPSVEQIQGSQMFEFKEFINDRHGLNLENYHDLHDWSVNRIPEFWDSAWSFFNILHSQPYTQVVMMFPKCLEQYGLREPD